MLELRQGSHLYTHKIESYNGLQVVLVRQRCGVALGTLILSMLISDSSDEADIVTGEIRAIFPLPTIPIPRLTSGATRTVCTAALQSIHSLPERQPLTLFPYNSTWQCGGRWQARIANRASLS